MNQTPQTYLLRDDGTFPNHPRWPLLIYAGVLRLSAQDPALDIEELFRTNGWGGSWRNGIYPFHHYHSNAHEVLGVYGGIARVQFGGPKGVEIELHTGDVAVLPAGTAHRKLSESGGFGVVGAYPSGQQHWDLCRGDPGEHSAAIARIKQVSKPSSDPVFGTDGGLRELWRD